MFNLFGDKTKYSQNITCDNCYKNMVIRIKKGVVADKYCKDRPCPICGCKKLRSTEKPETYY